MPGAQGSFIQPAVPAGTATQSNGPWNLGIQFTCSVAGNNLLGVYFHKAAGDTGTHTATIYRTDTTAVVGQQAFAGETASGWQFLTLTTPIALTAGLAYRVAVSHNTATYEAQPSPSAISLGPYTLSATGYGAPGAGTTYPSSSFSFYFLVDVLVDGLPSATQMVASQVLGEAWTTDSAIQLVASQVLGEAWVATTGPGYRRMQVSAQVI